MKMRKLMVVMVIFCLCVGAAWAGGESDNSADARKSISNVYQIDVMVATTNISPQTTSMLLIATNNISTFDGASVSWRTVSGNNRRGVIIPSGMHILAGTRTWTVRKDVPRGTPGSIRDIATDGTRLNTYYINESRSAQYTIGFDFRPGSFYYISIPGGEGNLQYQVTDLTNDANWSPEKGQMERIIQQHTNTTAQPAQGTRPAQGGGLQGALDRAANTVTTNLQQGDKIAIVSFTGENAEFAQAELEVLLVNNNNRFIIVDRAELDKIRREHQFQLTGEVDDKTAVDIGKFAAAQVVITGSISGSGEMRRLRLRALSTQTAQVLAAASEAF